MSEAPDPEQLAATFPFPMHIFELPLPTFSKPIAIERSFSDLTPEAHQQLSAISALRAELGAALAASAASSLLPLLSRYLPLSRTLASLPPSALSSSPSLSFTPVLTSAATKIESNSFLADYHICTLSLALTHRLLASQALSTRDFSSAAKHLALSASILTFCSTQTLTLTLSPALTLNLVQTLAADAPECHALPLQALAALSAAECQCAHVWQALSLSLSPGTVARLCEGAAALFGRCASQLKGISMKMRADVGVYVRQRTHMWKGLTLAALAMARRKDMRYGEAISVLSAVQRFVPALGPKEEGFGYEEVRRRCMEVERQWREENALVYAEMVPACEEVGLNAVEKVVAMEAGYVPPEPIQVDLTRKQGGCTIQ